MSEADDIAVAEHHLFERAEVLADHLHLMKMSDLLLKALTDLEEAIQLPEVVISPGHWLQRTATSQTRHNPPKQVCMICLAGAVLYQGLHPDPNIRTITTTDMPKSMAKVMHTLNCLRTGHGHVAAREWYGADYFDSRPELAGRLLNMQSEYVSIMPQMTDTGRFLAFQQQMATELAALGL